MKKYVIWPVFLLLTTLFALSCSQPEFRGVSPSAQDTSQKASAKEMAEETWEIEWEKDLIEAKKEGRIVVYNTALGTIRNAAAPAFKNRFGISVEDITGRGGEISNKILTERRAGLHIADVYIGGAGTMVLELKPAGVLDPLEPALVLPEVLDSRAWYRENLMWVDPQKKNVLAFLAYPSRIFAINTRLVKPDEIKSYRDFINPKWKGKIIMNDPTTAGSGSMAFHVLGFHILDLDFFREMALLEPIITRDQRLQVEWLAQGKYAIAYAPQTSIVTEFKRVGASVDYIVPREGTYLSPGSGNIGLVNRAPHPRAARIFINWLLSREGVGIFSRSYGTQGARTDVPEEGIEPSNMRQPGVTYWFGAHTEEVQLKEPETKKVAREIFGHLLK